jgi:hypothetical protein
MLANSHILRDALPHLEAGIMGYASWTGDFGANMWHLSRNLGSNVSRKGA